MNKLTITKPEREMRRFRQKIADGFRDGRGYVRLPLSIAAELLSGYDAAQELRAEQGQLTQISARPGKQEIANDRHHSNG